MASGITKLGVASLAALAAVVAFIVLSPKNESSEGRVSTPTEHQRMTQQAEVGAPVVVPAAKVSATDITLDLNVIGNNQKPILNLKTNLPPKSILRAILANPIDQGGDGYVAEVEGAVGTDQVVQFGPFSKTGDSLSPGIYLLTVTTIGADLEPKEVQDFFGPHGEGLTGRQVSIVPGTSERLVLQKFQFKINPNGSIDGPASDTPVPSSPAPNAAGEVWQKVQGTDPEIYVMTKVGSSPVGFSQGGIVVMYIVENLPEGDIVEAPRSVEYNIWGNCAARQYTVIGSLYFSDKNRGGSPVTETGAESVQRELIPGSPLEKAFDMLCRIAREQK